MTLFWHFLDPPPLSHVTFGDIFRNPPSPLKCHVLFEWPLMTLIVLRKGKGRHRGGAPQVLHGKEDVLFILIFEIVLWRGCQIPGKACLTWTCFAFPGWHRSDFRPHQEAPTKHRKDDTQASDQQVLMRSIPFPRKQELSKKYYSDHWSTYCKWICFRFSPTLTKISRMPFSQIYKPSQTLAITCFQTIPTSPHPKKYWFDSEAHSVSQISRALKWL